MRGVPKSLYKKRCQMWLEAVGLTEFQDRLCGKYSGGNKRKLSTCVAFVGMPTLSVLDEPSSGMDPSARRRMWSIVDAACQNSSSVLFSTHFMDEADELGNRIGILQGGMLRCLGTSQHLKVSLSRTRAALRLSNQFCPLSVLYSLNMALATSLKSKQNLELT